MNIYIHIQYLAIAGFINIIATELTDTSAVYNNTSQVNFDPKLNTNRDQNKQTRFNNDVIKDSLDNFKMIRRRTHFIIPQEFNDKYYLKSLRTINKDSDSTPEIEAKDYTDPKFTSKEEIAIYNTEDVANWTLKHDNNKTNIEDDAMYDNSTFKTSLLEDPILFNVLTKQTSLVERLLTAMQDEHNILRSKDDFEELLQELDDKKVEDIVENHNITIITTNKPLTKLSTVITLVDETEVRLALKRDPYVQRILKMAAKKGINYRKRIQGKP